MELITIEKIEKENVDEQVIEQLSKVLAYTEPERYEDYVGFWQEWFLNKIPGDKITIIAKKHNYIIGVTRFWRTPFCNNKWLVEGLEVVPPEREKRIGKSIVNEGIHILRQITDEKIYVNISRKNTASIKLHESLGFKKVITGTVDSYGGYKENLDEYILDTVLSL